MRRVPGDQTPRRQGKAHVVALFVLLSACAKAAPPPPAAEPAPPAPPVATPAVAALPTVAAVTGRYQLRTDLPRRQAAARGRQRAVPATPLQLLSTAARSPDGMTAVSRQFVATATIPGYAASARGRESAWWWPIAGDSVVIHTVTRDGHRLQLRGAVSRTAIQGEVWITAGDNTYQLGTFTATRSR